MKILMVNHTLKHYAGSETFTYTLARELTRLGHEVTCFSPRLGQLADRLGEADIPVIDSLASLPDDIDIIHAHHRHESLLAFVRFPDKPMILVCHGVLPRQEQPFRSRLNIHHYVAVSEEVRAHLFRRHRIDPKEVSVIRNGIDLERFGSREPIAPRPRRALVVSNYMPDPVRALIDRVCGRLDITVAHVGKAASIWAVEEEINRADLVFALGRSALEALACKRAVVVLDYNGGDGLVTPDNFHLLRLRNFSGRTFRLRYTEENLQAEIERYDPSTAEPIYEMVRRDHDVRRTAQQFLTLYEDAIRRPPRRPGSPELARRQYRVTAELIEDVNRLQRMVDAGARSIHAIHQSRGWRTLSALRQVRGRFATWRGRSSARLRRARVLVVDDDPFLSRWLVEALASDGHEVDSAHDGQGALLRLESCAYDVILSDLRMPHMDGVEFYRRLERDRPEIAHQVLFLSGHAPEYEDFLRDFRGRSVGKPVDLEDLQRLVRATLDAR